MQSFMPAPVPTPQIPPSQSQGMIAPPGTSSFQPSSHQHFNTIGPIGTAAAAPTVSLPMSSRSSNNQVSSFNPDSIILDTKTWHRICAFRQSPKLRLHAITQLYFKAQYKAVHKIHTYHCRRETLGLQCTN